MRLFFTLLIYLSVWTYQILFFWIMHTFIPLRKNSILRILAFIASVLFTNTIVYLNDLTNILLSLCGMVIYMAVFHQGKWIEKLTAVFIFYPIMIAVNFLIQNMGSEVFFFITDAPIGPEYGWTEQMYLLDTAIYAISNIIRLFFWMGIWHFLKKSLETIRLNLNIKGWLIIDSMILIASVSCFTAIYFITDQPAAVYPLCVSAVFSSVGCIYLVAYMSDAVQKAYENQKMAIQQQYFEEKLQEEKQIKSIYHDMKNHLLIFENNSNAQDMKQAARELRTQIETYENYIHTGNVFLDTIVKNKAIAAKDKEIDFTAQIDFEGIDFIEPLDISTIFGNAMDNAIEACEKLPVSKRVILVKTGKVHHFFVILIQNNYEPCDQIESGQKNFLHGFGIPNLKKAVEKYGGTCVINQADGVFQLKILIPLQ